MYLLIVFLPLCGFLCASSCGRFIGGRGACVITTGCVMLSALFSWVALYEVGLSTCPAYVHGLVWMESELFDSSWGFLFDSITVVMCIVITSVSTLVHLYSIDYMEADPHRPRFMSYLSFFTFCMLMLVTGDNFLQLFFGWEGVGVASYLLINFWYSRLQANKSAIKAMLVNRVGDIGLALGIFILFSFCGSVDYTVVFACIHHFVGSSLYFCMWEHDVITAACVCLFVGCVGKSAQLGLHTWLPDAMEGPTPVSALIHAATMVTAGVFLLARCSPIFELSPSALGIVTIVGSCTAFFAASTGLVQNDMKRVIAYSTCSQLGYMIFACGLSQYHVGMFHLMNHAFFKALLFLCAGSVIHAVNDEQDMRKMGGLIHVLPFTYTMMGIGTLAIIGFPFLTGFYSKDVILECAYASYTVHGCFAYWLGSISALCTSYYSFRLLILTFFGNFRGPKVNLAHVHDAPFCMSVPLCILAFGSLFGGFLGKEAFIGLGSSFWNGAIVILPEHTLHLEAEYIPQWIKMLPLVSGLLGLIVSFCVQKFSHFFYGVTLQTSWLYLFLNRRWLVDKFYNDVLASPFMQFGYNVSFKNIDKGVLELTGPVSIPSTVKEMSRFVSSFHTGFIYHVAFVVLLAFFLSFTIICDISLISFFSFDVKSFFVVGVGILVYGVSTYSPVEAK